MFQRLPMKGNDREGLPGRGTHGQRHGGEKQSGVAGGVGLLEGSGKQWTSGVGLEGQGCWQPSPPLYSAALWAGFPQRTASTTPPCDRGSLSHLGLVSKALLTVPTCVFPPPLNTRVPSSHLLFKRRLRCSPVAKPPLVISVCGGLDQPPGPGKGRLGL